MATLCSIIFFGLILSAYAYNKSVRMNTSLQQLSCEPYQDSPPHPACNRSELESRILAAVRASQSSPVPIARSHRNMKPCEYAREVARRASAVQSRTRAAGRKCGSPATSQELCQRWMDERYGCVHRRLSPKKQIEAIKRECGAGRQLARSVVGVRHGKAVRGNKENVAGSRGPYEDDGGQGSSKRTQFLPRIVRRRRSNETAKPARQAASVGRSRVFVLYDRIVNFSTTGGSPERAKAAGNKRSGQFERLRVAIANLYAIEGTVKTYRYVGSKARRRPGTERTYC